MPYTVRTAPRAEEQLKALAAAIPREDLEGILSGLEDLAAIWDPSTSERLPGGESGLYRDWVGGSRVVYAVTGQELIVLSITAPVSDRGEIVLDFP